MTLTLNVQWRRRHGDLQLLIGSMQIATVFPPVRGVRRWMSDRTDGQEFSSLKEIKEAVMARLTQ